jgi:probable O-glycosylation ligase (exosortase A-associated)
MKPLLFTYLLTYGGALASLCYPFVGLLIYVCFAIIKPESIWPWAVPEGNYSRIVAIALLVGWVFRGFGTWQFGRAKPIVAALLGYWAWSVVGAYRASDHAIAWHFVEELTKIVLPFVVGMTVIDSARQLKQLAWIILLSQGYVAFEFNLSYYEGFNRVTELVEFGGLDNNSIAIAMVSCVGLGFFLGMQERRWWLKLIAFGATALMAHVVLFSFSRGGMLALIATGIATLVFTPKRPMHFLTFAVAVLLVLRLAGPQVQERFQTVFVEAEQRDASAQSRLDLWNDCLDSMAKRPFFGVGPDHWPLVVSEYGWPAGKAAHSLWLQVGAELGIPGVAFLALFYALCMIRLWRFTRARQPVSDPWFRDAARMVIASLLGFTVAAQFVTVNGLEAPYYVVLVGAGTLKLCSRSAESEQPAPNGTANRPEGILACA